MAADAKLPNGSPRKAASHARLTIVGRAFILLTLLLSLVGRSTFTAQAATAITFTAGELLGAPTDTSIAVNVVPASTIECHYQYGTAPASYTGQTPTLTATGGQPHEVVIGGLTANTEYYYRMRYHLPGETDWVARAEHSFWTQRAAGSSFVFTVTSDSHARYTGTDGTNYRQAMQNIIADQPDFEVDLGDTQYVDSVASQSAVDNAYLAARASDYLGAIGPSVPIFLSSGNHENEEGWNLDDTPFSLGLGSIQARKAFFPTPIDGGFYTANTDTLAAINEVTYGDELREDYYAWEWGDALFVVIDPFQYTMDLPYSPVAGEGSDDPVTGNQWSWTLGQEQFEWLKDTLEGSDARYKFVFSHQVVGGVPDVSTGGGGPGYVRGGAGAAPYFEWGGKNADGTWGFDAQRPGWGGVPIHQLMAANGVSAYFHGHDHQYVYEVLDGIVYQEVPSPSMAGAGFGGIYDEADPFTIEILPNAGHLRITVTPDEATVEYVRSSTTGVSYTYEIAPNDVTPEYDIVASAGANGSIDPFGTVVVAEGDDRTFSITAAGGYRVANVLVDGASVGTPTSYEFTDVQADHTIAASFEVIPGTTYALTVAVSPAGGGTTNPTAGSHDYAEDAVVNVTATASSGYQFDHWSGACSGAGACSVTMDADKSVTANFVAESGVLGDVNGDGVANSTDALIVLSCDVGMDTSQFCPMNCGDVNADGQVNSTDALVILSYDAGMSVPFAVGQPGCPSSVTPCSGCTP